MNAHTYTLQAALIMQVLSLTDDQIQLLPPEQRKAEGTDCQELHPLTPPTNSLLA